MHTEEIDYCDTMLSFSRVMLESLGYSQSQIYTGLQVTHLPSKTLRGIVKAARLNNFTS